MVSPVSSDFHINDEEEEEYIDEEVEDTVEETVFESPKNEKHENIAIGVRKFFIHFFDLAASLVFIFAVIIIVLIVKNVIANKNQLVKGGKK